MIALTKNGLQPETMSLKDIILAHIEHRKEIVRRRAEFDLKKAEERAHILIGLHKALDNIDAVISTIKKSKDKDDAHNNLVKNLNSAIFRQPLFWKCACKLWRRWNGKK